MPSQNDGVDRILGMPFLKMANPNICWKTKMAETATRRCRTAKTVIIARDKLDAEVEEKRELRSAETISKGSTNLEVSGEKKTIIDELNSLGLLDR